MDLRLGIRAALLALLATTVTTLGVTAPTATGADPGLGAPALGTCYDLSAREVAESTYTEPPIDCATTHTAEVIAVLTIPDGVPLDLANGKVTKLLQSTCWPAVDQRIGARKSFLKTALTAYGFGYFLPTAEQQALGARWVRCDLILFRGTKLGALPKKPKLGDLPFKDTVARCLTGKKTIPTTCNQKHNHRATAALRIDLKKYPSEDRWIKIGTDRCRNAVRSRTYRFSWPAKATWKVGRKALVCYTVTKR